MEYRKNCVPVAKGFQSGLVQKSPWMCWKQILEVAVWCVGESTRVSLGYTESVKSTVVAWQNLVCVVCHCQSSWLIQIVGAISIIWCSILIVKICKSELFGVYFFVSLANFSCVKEFKSIWPLLWILSCDRALKETISLLLYSLYLNNAIAI